MENVKNNLQALNTRGPTAPATTVGAGQQQAQFDAAFKANADKDGGGDVKHLSRSEFRGAINEALGKDVSNARADKLFDVADGIMGDGDGKIGKDEFSKLGKTLSLLEDGKAAVEAKEEGKPGGPEGKPEAAGGKPEAAKDRPAAGPSGADPAEAAGPAGEGEAMSLDDLWQLLLAMADTNGDGKVDRKELEALKNKLKAGAGEDGKRAIDDLFHKIGRAAGADGVLTKGELGGMKGLDGPDGAMKTLAPLLTGLKEKGTPQDVTGKNDDVAAADPATSAVLQSLIGLSGGSLNPGDLNLGDLAA